MKETDLFEPVKELLLNVGCNEVYAEVLNHDVIGFMGQRTVIVEMKKQMSFKVIEQAIGGKRKADYIFVAVPRPKTAHSKLAIQLLKEHGIGLIYIQEMKLGNSLVAFIDFWGRRNKSPLSMREYIKPHHLQTIGGAKSGDGPTEYSYMIDDIKRFLLRKNTWVSVDDILDNVSRASSYYKRPKESIIITLKAHWNASWCERKTIDRKTHFRHIPPSCKTQQHT